MVLSSQTWRDPSHRWSAYKSNNIPHSWSQNSHQQRSNRRPLTKRCSQIQKCIHDKNGVFVRKLIARIVTPCLMICNHDCIRHHSLPFEQLLMSPVGPSTVQDRLHQLPNGEICLLTELSPPESESSSVTWQRGSKCSKWGGLVGHRSIRQDALGPFGQIQFFNIFIYSFCFPLYFSILHSKIFSQMLPGVSFIFLQDLSIYSSTVLHCDLFQFTHLFFIHISYCELELFHIHS